MKKLIVPTNWGIKPDEIGMGDIMAFGSPELARAERKAEHLLNAAIRQTAERAGLLIEESPEFKDADNNDEYTYRGSLTSDRDEFAYIEQQVEGINVPKRYEWNEYAAHPVFPAMARKDGSSMGRYKYLLDEPEQWRKFEMCATQEVLTYPEEHPWKDYPVEHNGSLVKESYFMQEFIECPSKHYASYRIMISCTGEIICAGLLYSDHTKNEEVKVTKAARTEDLWERPWKFRKEDFLDIEHSPVFLNARKITSNRSQDGRGIVLNPKESSLRPNDKEKQILVDHNLNPENPQIPDELVRLSKEVAKVYGKKKGLLMGIDFIQGKNGKFYYLETNLRPGLKTYADFAYNGEYKDTGEENIKLYTELFEKIIHGIVNKS